MAPEIDEFVRRVHAATPEPESVHFVERAEKNYHALVLQFLQALGDTIELPHPRVISGPARRNYVSQVDRVFMPVEP